MVLKPSASGRMNFTSGTQWMQRTSADRDGSCPPKTKNKSSSHLTPTTWSPSELPTARSAVPGGYLEIFICSSIFHIYSQEGDEFFKLFWYGDRVGFFTGNLPQGNEASDLAGISTIDRSETFVPFSCIPRWLPIFSIMIMERNSTLPSILNFLQLKRS